MEPVVDVEEVPIGLQLAIRQGRCVAFAGAGFSAAAGLPTWDELISAVARDPSVPEEVRAFVLDALADGRATRKEEAAQILYNALTKEPFVRALRQHLNGRPLNETMKRRLELLGGIPFRFILTTNFDDVLAGQLPVSSTFAGILQPRSDAARHTTRGYPPVDPRVDPAATVKLHGDLEHPESVVFSRLDYREQLYAQPAYLSFLRSVFLHNTVLYLGFSFTDTYINELRSEVLSVLGEAGAERPLAYALLSNVPALTRTYMRAVEGIEVIPYHTDFKDFSGFDRFLERLHHATSPIVHFGRLLSGKRILWLDPRPESVHHMSHGFFTAAARAASSDGHELEFVDTVDEALAALRARRPDLVITHWGHGRGRPEDGAAAVSLLRTMRREAIEAPVIVFASGMHFAENKRRALALGALGFYASWEGLARGIEGALDMDLETA